MAVASAERRRWKVLTQPSSFPIPAGAAAAVALPAGECVVRVLEAPFGSLRRAARVLPTLLDIQLPFPMEDCRIQFLDLHRGPEGKARALAVVCRREDFDRRLSRWQAAGVDPLVVDHEGLAAWTQAEHELPVAAGFTGIRAVVYAGTDRRCLAVGRGLRFLGAHAVGGDEPGADVGRLLRAYCNPDGDSIDWILAGPRAEAPEWSGLPARLSAQWPGKARTVAAPGDFLARAVAVRAVSDGPLRLNLRSGDAIHPLALRRQSRRLAGAIALLLVGAGVLWGTVLSRGLARHRYEEELAHRLQAAVDRVAGYSVAARGEHAMRVARDAFAERVKDVRPFVAPFEESSSERLAWLVAAADGAGLRLETLMLNDTTVSLAGSAAAWSGPEQVARMLEKAGYRVALDRREADAEERIPFTLQATREFVP